MPLIQELLLINLWLKGEVMQIQSFSWVTEPYQNDPLQHLCCLASSLTQSLAQLLILFH